MIATPASSGSAAAETHVAGERPPSSKCMSAAVSAAPTTALGPWPMVRLLTKVSRTVEATV